MGYGRAGYPALHLQYFHDLRLVRAAEIPQCSDLAADPRVLGHRLFEYCFVVPANHIGARVYTAAQLKTMQEVITLTVFAGFSPLYLAQPLKWNHAVAFVFLVLAAYFGLKKF